MPAGLEAQVTDVLVTVIAVGGAALAVHFGIYAWQWYRGLLSEREMKH